MGLLTIGAVAKASRLSPKALRLFDELGLLPPSASTRLPATARTHRNSWTRPDCAEHLVSREVSDTVVVGGGCRSQPEAVATARPKPISATPVVRPSARRIRGLWRTGPALDSRRT